MPGSPRGASCSVLARWKRSGAVSTLSPKWPAAPGLQFRASGGAGSGASTDPGAFRNPAASVAAPPRKSGPARPALSDQVLSFARTTPLAKGVRMTDGRAVPITAGRGARGNGAAVRPIRASPHRTSTGFAKCGVPRLLAAGRAGVSAPTGAVCRLRGGQSLYQGSWRLQLWRGRRHRAQVAREAAPSGRGDRDRSALRLPCRAGARPYPGRSWPARGPGCRQNLTAMLRLAACSVKSLAKAPS